MGFLSFFKLKLFDPDAFDKELTTLTQGISKTRNQITAITAKRKATRNNLVFSLLVAYIAWIAYRYRISLSNLGPLAGTKSHLAIFFSGQETHDLIQIAVVPLIIAILVYLVDTLFHFLITSKDKHLKSLLKRHRTKIDDLKRVSNFNTTNELLKKYSKSELRPDVPKIEPKKLTKETNVKTAQPAKIEPKPQSQGKKLPPTVNRPQQKIVQPQPPSPVVSPIHKTFQDRVLDYIIGSDHNESVESRYALICANCYTHNGLAPPGCTDPNLVTYICRQCGFINGTMDRTPSPEETEKGREKGPEKGTDGLEEKVKEIEEQVKRSEKEIDKEAEKEAGKEESVDGKTDL